jgi:thymidylate kinase
MIIGLGHRRGVGKNTVAGIMKNHFEHKGHTVALVSFASKLKEIAYDLYSWGGMQSEAYYEQNYAEKEKMLYRLGKSPRTIWIELGNKMREIHPETWVKAALTRKADVTIMTDARYPNELEAIKDAQGLLIKVTNANVKMHDDVADSAAKEFKGWDYYVDNSSSKEKLEQVVENLMPHLYGSLA